MKEESKKMWVSKYALTSEVCEVLATESEDGKYFYPTGTWFGLKLGRDIHDSKEKAQIAAEVMRAKKLKSLEKQIAQIKAAMV